jgi:hypothetical protein
LSHNWDHFPQSTIQTSTFQQRLCRTQHCPRRTSCYRRHCSTNTLPHRRRIHWWSVRWSSTKWGPARCTSRIERAWTFDYFYLMGSNQSKKHNPPPIVHAVEEDYQGESYI